MGEAECSSLKALMREYTAECVESTGIKPTFSDLFIRACALSLQKNPLLNAYFMDDHVLVKGEINIGLAVSLGAVSYTHLQSIMGWRKKKTK